MVDLQKDGTSQSPAGNRHITFECSAEVRALIGDEVFLFETPIIRVNKYGWRNSRVLVLTHDSLLVLKQKSKRSKEVRLRRGYEELLGLTISLHRDSHELVCHCHMQADVRMSSRGARKELVDTIKMFYATKTRQNLPIYGVRQKSLGIYTTQESDVVKGISRVPLPLSRL